MTERKCLETKPGAELIVSQFLDQDKILVPHTVHTFPVDARLVGTDHPGKQGLGIEILPDILRALVNSEEKTHSVAGTVAEIAPGLPEGFPGQGIYLATCRATRENCHCKVNMALKDKGVIFSFKGSYRS